jgi:hypothetical protein
MELSDSQESYSEFSELWAPLHNEQLFKTDPNGMYRIERPRLAWQMNPVTKPASSENRRNPYIAQSNNPTAGARAPLEGRAPFFPQKRSLYASTL